MSLIFPFLSQTASLRLLRWSTVTFGTTPAEAVAARREAAVRVVKCILNDLFKSIEEMTGRRNVRWLFGIVGDGRGDDEDDDTSQ